jgi:hypothetical protein
MPVSPSTGVRGVVSQLPGTEGSHFEQFEFRAGLIGSVSTFFRNEEHEYRLYELSDFSIMHCSVITQVSAEGAPRPRLMHV